MQNASLAGMNVGLNPFLQQLGVEILSAENGRAQLSLMLSEQHMNSWQITHGGVLMTLLDVAMAMAGHSAHPEQKGVVTVEMKTMFLQAGGVPTERLLVTGEVFHRSTTMCFCEGAITLGEQLVAKASGTFKYLRRMPPTKKNEVSQTDGSD